MVSKKMSYFFHDKTLKKMKKRKLLHFFSSFNENTKNT